MNFAQRSSAPRGFFSFATAATVASLATCIVGTASCAKTLPPDDPTGENAKDGDGGDSLPPDRPMMSDNGPSVPVTVKDDTSKKAMSCGGATIPDLLAVLSQSACEVANAKPDEPQKDLKGQLEVKVVTDAPKVAPGATAQVTVTFHNKGKTVLPLDFALDPEPRFDFEVYTLKGTRADKPAGDSPALPPDVQNAPEPDKAVARVTLAPNGTATMTTSWTAVKFKWASKDKAKGAVPGRGYPHEPGAPLPKGKYALRVITPLVGVSEESDHELSQPRVLVDIGSP
jgi:hypothetical protein